MKSSAITAVGIDVSKNKSMVAVRRPGGEIVMHPFEVCHTSDDLNWLASTLKKLGGDIRIVMEHTGNYWRPLALTLKKAGFFVSVVNAMLIHDFSDNSIRKLKTDRADSLKIANYALTFWKRLLLKTQSRMYERITTTATALKNGLIALSDQTFAGVNLIFDDATKSTEGHFKWVDFFMHYWHRDCVCKVTLEAFMESYRCWCKRKKYRFRSEIAQKVYESAKKSVSTLPKCESTKILITQACKSLNAICEAKQACQCEMQRLASLLPEYDIVMSMEGAGPVTGPILMADVAFAGVDAPPFQSGAFESKSRHVSKRGSPHLRRTLFTVSGIILQLSHRENQVFCFMDKKRSEGKHFYVYMIAGAAKFLRIYYATVTHYLKTVETPDFANC